MRSRRWPVAILIALSFTGCSSAARLETTVLEYDHAVAEVLSKELLLNIARARHSLPVHFTAVSNIAATFRMGLSAGATPALTGDKGYLVMPLLGSGVEVNPTISIVPMQGDEFTQRMLTPFRDHKVTQLLRQGYDVDALLRLMANEIRLAKEDDPKSLQVHHNRPSDRTGYPVFRKVVSHLSSIQDRHALYAEPLTLTSRWSIAADAFTPQASQALNSEYTIAFDEKNKVFNISKRTQGRVILSNYDPSLLTEEERRRLFEEAESGPLNEILVDIRAAHTGGEYPLHSKIRVRSFHDMLTFLGRSIAEEPEYAVEPDPRTPAVAENPNFVLKVMEVEDLPSDAGVWVSLNDRHYTLEPEKGYQWNRKAFSLLYQLFQMTVSQVPSTGPAITISK